MANERLANIGFGGVGAGVEERSEERGVRREEWGEGIEEKGLIREERGQMNEERGVRRGERREA